MFMSQMNSLGRAECQEHPLRDHGTSEASALDLDLGRGRSWLTAGGGEAVV